MVEKNSEVEIIYFSMPTTRWVETVREEVRDGEWTEWRANGIARAALVNKSCGLAIPQDAAGLPGRLMTSGLRYNEVVCLGSVLVNSSVSTSGPAGAQHLYKSLTVCCCCFWLMLAPPLHPAPQMVLPLYQTPPRLTITILPKSRSPCWWGRNGGLIR